MMFEWTRRMGVHQAYHLSVANKIIHGVCIPFQLWGIVRLLSVLINHFWIVLLLSPIYCLCEPTMGGSFAAFLWLLSFFGRESHFLWGPAIFVCANLFQTRVGHALETGGRDDTKKNMAEFKKTKNPIPLLLIFWYHWVEVFFLLGYKPELKREVDAAQHAQERAF